MEQKQEINPIAIGTNINLYQLDYEALLSLGMTAREAYDEARWIIGDIAAVIHQKFGYPGLEDFATKVGIPKSSIDRYREVARKIPVEMREEYKKLSWTHFRAVAAQPNAKEWLEKADQNDWGSEQLQVEIKKITTGIKDLTLRPRLLRCEFCGYWYIDPKDKEKMCRNNGRHYERKS
jgi:hypothetical protein